MSQASDLEVVTGRLGDSETARILRGALEQSAEFGFLGPGPFEQHLDHALAMASVVHGLDPMPARLLDLGSGGGVPGLVLACVFPETQVLLVDSQQRRCQFLRESVESLGCHDRVRVLEGRAEAFGHDPDLRGAIDVVTARSFGPPAVTAECAAGLLRVGGHLVVSEPPAHDPNRWPADGLRTLGLGEVQRPAAPVSTAVIRLEYPCDDRFPRRIGVPGRRPLWTA